MHPTTLKINDFLYPLPQERIAQYPSDARDLSKLLVYRQGNITESVYANIAQELPAQSLLVFNNSKVIRARVLFKNENGAEIEIFCLEPIGEMYQTMASHGACKWHCLVGKASKWKQKTLRLTSGGFELSAVLIEKTADSNVVEFSWQPAQLTFAEVLDKTGVLPIPPYLKRETEEVDLARYQTIYAKHDGSVAAPTAGLHFTDAIFKSLSEKGITRQELTLHVGAGTFKPVKSETMKEHHMHAELFSAPILLIESLIAHLKAKKPVIAVGTTTLRTLESLYWLGSALLNRKSLYVENIFIGQWDAYETSPECTPLSALEALLQFMKESDSGILTGRTQIIIAPPYRLKVAEALITNFHQPGSTLLLLVAAVLGKNWRSVYDYALEHDFRFLSYGDGSLLWSK